MSDLYANITETVQHDPDRPGVHTTVYADLHTGDPAVMAATLRGVADSLDPGDPVEAEEWAARQADERAARDAALVAPWREAFRALSGVIPDRYASRARAESAGPRPRHVCDEKRGALIIGAGDTDRCGCWVVGVGTLTARRLEPAGRTDALDGPEPRPSPRHVKAILDDLKPVAESVPVDVLDLVRQYGDARWSEGTELDGGGPNWSAARSKAAEHLARIEAEVQRLRDRDALLTKWAKDYERQRDEALVEREEAREKLAESQATAAGMRDTLNLLREALRAETITDALAAIERLRAERDEARADFDRLAASHEAYVKAVADAQRLVALKDVAVALKVGDDSPPRVPATADPPRERTYTIQLNRAQNIELLTWLSTNAHGGSISIGRRLTIDVVEGGGLLVHARPYRFDDRATEDVKVADDRSEVERLRDERDSVLNNARDLRRMLDACRAGHDEARQAGWRDGVRWAAAEADAQGRDTVETVGPDYTTTVGLTVHLRLCAADPDRPTLVSRDQAPETRP